MPPSNSFKRAYAWTYSNQWRLRIDGIVFSQCFKIPDIFQSAKS